MFSNKEEEQKLQLTKGNAINSSKVDSSKTISTKMDSSIQKLLKDIQLFYQGNVDEDFKIRKLLNQNEAELAKTNLKIIHQIDTTIQHLVSIEIEKKNQRIDLANSKVNEARSTIRTFSLISFYIVLCIVLLQIVSIYRLVKYESALISAREEALKMVNLKSRFLSNMSHEIRSPLTSIMGFADVLDSKQLDSDTSKYIKAIQSSSDHLLQTVNDILDFSKLEAGKMLLDKQPFNLYETISEVSFAFTKIASDTHLALKNDLLIPNNTRVVADKHKFKQILFNILSNAIKFTDHGQVVVSCDCILKDDKVIEFLLKVTDTGIGIAENQLNNIFDEFTQITSTNIESGTKKFIKGTGLGLPICKMLTELQNGAIEVKSEINHGTTFTVKLTYDLEIITKPKLDLQPNLLNVSINIQNHLAGKKALIIEDNKMNKLLLELLVKKNNMLFESVSDGLEGLKMIEQNDYDIILTDINVPGLTGGELAKAVKKMESPKFDIPIIALTASIFEDDVETYLENGITAILVKPYKENELINLINLHIA